MKAFIVLMMFCIILSFAPSSFSWELAWFNLNQLLDHNGYPIAPGGLVQLIADGGRDGVDDPMEWWMSQVDPCAAQEAWRAAGCPPVGDDYLVASIGEPNPQHIQDFGPPPDGWGWFGALYIDSGVPAYGSGIGMYTRFFTAEQPAEGDYYGTVGVEEPGQPLVLYQLDNATFPVYMVMGGQLAMHQCPKPGMISLSLAGAVALSWSLLKKKK